MRWPQDLTGWPLHDWSRQVLCAPHRWHVQEKGTGPTILFLHGAGATTHSWAPVMEDMARDHHVVALDLPGHGFTALGTRNRSGLDAMTEDIAALCTDQGWHLSRIVAHSAGGAIALQLCDGALSQNGPMPAITAVNPALEDFDGAAGVFFPLIAKTLALNPLVPWLFTAGPNPEQRARRLIASTGSTIPAAQLACYARLLKDRNHVQGALNMMAQWSFRGLQARLPRMDLRCHVVLGARDTAVPPDRARGTIAQLKGCDVTTWPDLGHLAHEEDPAAMLAMLRTHRQAD